MLLKWGQVLSFRVYSTGKGSVESKLKLKLLDQQTIAKHFHVSFARSSGAGGQHVNTTDSKAVIKLTCSEWYGARGNWIPHDAFDALMQNLNDKTAPVSKKFPYFTPAGDVLITDSSTRYRDKNLAQCYTKFMNSVQTCSQLKEEVSEDTVKRWDKLKKRDNEVRLKDKKLKKDKKQTRRKVSLSDY